MIFSERGVNELLEKGGEPPLIQASKTSIISNRKLKTLVLVGFLGKKTYSNLGLKQLPVRVFFSWVC